MVGHNLACDLPIKLVGVALMFKMFGTAWGAAMMKGFLLVLALVLALALAATPARAVPVTFSGGTGSLSALATFDESGANLIITLSNTSSADVTGASQVLTSLFFSITGNPALTPSSARLAVGSTVPNGPDGGGNVGGEWAYRSSLSGAPSIRGFRAPGSVSSGARISGDLTSKDQAPGPWMAHNTESRL